MQINTTAVGGLPDDVIRLPSTESFIPIVSCGASVGDPLFRLVTCMRCLLVLGNAYFANDIRVARFLSQL